MASGIVSIWASTPEEIGPAVADLEARHPGRFLLGLGTSHSAIVGDYSRPYSKMVAFIDGLDALEQPVPPERRMLAALAPRMLELAAERAAGAHPYFVPVEHTALARRVIGPDRLLATEVAVVLETDPAKARQLARAYASIYLGLPNYTSNLRRFGYGDDDIDHGGSDRLIDAVIPWGDAATIADRVARASRCGRRPRLPPGRGRPAGLPARRVPRPGAGDCRALRSLFDRLVGPSGSIVGQRESTQ